jgi:hypothetical protein
MDGWNSSVAGMLGRPDLASGYGAAMAAPVQGGTAAVNSSYLSGGVSVQGDVATGQASLSLAAAITVLLIVLYFSTRDLQH